MVYCYVWRENKAQYIVLIHNRMHSLKFMAYDAKQEVPRSETPFRSEIWGSHDGDYEDSLFGCDVM
jgi:hypothetical protein